MELSNAYQIAQAHVIKTLNVVPAIAQILFADHLTCKSFHRHGKIKLISPDQIYEAHPSVIP